MAGEKRGATDAANGSGDAVFGEANAGGGKFVEVGSLDDGVARDAEGIVPPVISVKYEYVHLFFGRGRRDQERKGETRE